MSTKLNPLQTQVSYTPRVTVSGDPSPHPYRPSPVFIYPFSTRSDRSRDIGSLSLQSPLSTVTTLVPQTRRDPSPRYTSLSPVVLPITPRSLFQERTILRSVRHLRPFQVRSRSISPFFPRIKSSFTPQPDRPTPSSGLFYYLHSFSTLLHLFPSLFLFPPSSPFTRLPSLSDNYFRSLLNFPSLLFLFLPLPSLSLLSSISSFY